MAKKTSTTRAPTKALSARERLFAHEYVRHKFNGLQAAVAAGYAENSAKVTASRLLSKPNLKAYVERLSEKAIAKVDEKAQEVLDELRHVAMARLSRCLTDDLGVKPLSEWTEAERAALSKVDVEDLFENQGDEKVKIGVLRKIEMKGKQAALETLAKHHRLLVDRVEHEHSGTVYVVSPYEDDAPEHADTEDEG